MPKNVVCKKCNNLVNDWCEKVIDSPDPDMQRDCRYFCEKTNADRIRSMSDEELAEQLIQYRDDWGDYCTNKGCDATQKEAVKAETEWLQQPAEVE